MSYTNLNLAFFFTTHEIAYFDVPSYRMGMSLLFIHFHIMRQLIMLLQSVLSWYFLMRIKSEFFSGFFLDVYLFLFTYTLCT